MCDAMVVEYKQGQWKYFSQIAIINLQLIYYKIFLFLFFSKALVRSGASASKCECVRVCAIVYMRMRGLGRACEYKSATNTRPV